MTDAKETASITGMTEGETIETEGITIVTTGGIQETTTVTGNATGVSHHDAMQRRNGMGVTTP